MFKRFVAVVGLALAVVPPLGATLAAAEPTFEGKPVSAWLKDLAGKSDEAHEKAATVLAAAGKEAVPALAKALQDKNAALRERSAEVLGLIGEEAKGAVPELIAALKDKSEAVRGAAADALGGIGPDARAAVGPLIQLLK